MIANKPSIKQVASQDIRLLLDNIRSVHNVGSLFRTAETLGISHIYCAGTTPVPVDRFGRKRTDFAKVSLGSEEMVPWEHVAQEKIVGLLKDLKNPKKGGFKMIALEQSKESVDYKELEKDIGGPVLVILGNEVDGVSKDLLELADRIAEIPMKGKKESLNVSVAAGIALFRWFDR